MRYFNKKYWPGQVRLDAQVIERKFKVEDLERWCYQNLKSSDWRNDGWYFAFKREKDCTFFMLRWS
jgi:hypothetical protein